MRRREQGGDATALEQGRRAAMRSIERARKSRVQREDAAWVLVLVGITTVDATNIALVGDVHWYISLSFAVSV